MLAPLRKTHKGTCCVTLLALLLSSIMMLYIPQEIPSFLLNGEISSSRRSTEKIHVSSLLHKNSTQHSNVSSDSVNGSKTTVTHLRFLKVHKAGSTTLQNMLFRFGMRHDLDILLPRRGNYLYTKGASISTPKSGYFDIFACHTVYSKRWFDSILPKDSVNIGIVRNPPDRMISAAYYYRDVFSLGYLRNVPKLNFIHNLVQHPEQYEVSKFSRTRNSMGKDFGFSSSLTSNDADNINSHLRLLDNEFSLVMIMERFEESLVLLRRLLNWSILDILYLRANSHVHKPVALEPFEITKLKNTCFLDYALYDYFLNRFNERVKHEGSDFYDEVATFNTALEKVNIFCESSKDDILHIEETKWNGRVSMPRTECSLMKTAEQSFIHQLRQRQGKRLG